MNPNILYNIVCLMILNISFSQTTYLKATGKDSISEIFLKKIKTKNTFKNIKELQNELERIKVEASRHGYFNTSIKKQKVNDSTQFYSLKLNNRACCSVHSFR